MLLEKVPDICKFARKLANLSMLSTKKHTPQLGLFHGLSDQLDQKHPLYQLAEKINWFIFDTAFEKHYNLTMGKPAKPIRLMVALLILKYLRNLSDENIVKQWAENCYYQYFSGKQHFQPNIPCVPTELVAFRQRVGEPWVELILQESIRVNEPPDDMNSGLGISVDTTVQEKDITYPKDDKLYKKIIKKCWKIADTESVDLRQSYKNVVKQLSNLQRFKGTKYGAKAARKANKKIKIIAGRLVRDLGRKLPLQRLGTYLPYVKIFQIVLSQKRSDSNKIYSLHEPDVKCYSKGKEHKRFEFSSKASFLVDESTDIIMGAINFIQTLHDSKTIPDVLEQYERLNGKEVKEVFVDSGYKGMKEYETATIHVPKPDENITKEKRKRHSKRAAIEPMIGHLKQDYRLCPNFLKDILGDNMNVILAAAAMNFKRRNNLWRTEEIRRWLLIHNFLINAYWIFMRKIVKTTF